MMFHRILSILVTAGYLAGQLAFAPHAHDESSVGQYKSRPHLHLSQLVSGGHAHDLGHAHSHRQDAARGSRRGDDHAGSGHEGTLDDFDHGHNHDADAVYVPVGLSAGLASVQAQAKIPLMWRFAHPQALSAVVPLDGVPRPFSAVAASSPRGAPPGCPLFLSLRMLRI